jgi:hypothetical protein
MLIQAFTGPKLKIERAKRHIGELHRLCSAFLQREPYEMFTEEKPEVGEVAIKVRVKECVPLAWGAIVGDIAHNLRSALDQLICDLVIANEGKVTRGTGFIITETRETFETHFPNKITGISRKAERIVRRFKPYERGYGDKAGCPALRFLDWLDKRDKHQGIIMVGAASVAANSRTLIPANFTAPDPDGVIDIRMPPKGHPTFPVAVEDNTELVSD